MPSTGSAIRGALIGAVVLASCPTFGADTFDGTHLFIPAVLVGTTTYNNVVITIGNVVGLMGGTPTVAYDTYDGSTNQLTIPSVTYGASTYTNVTVTVGNVVSINGPGNIVTGKVSNTLPSNGLSNIPVTQSGAGSQSTTTDGGGNYALSGQLNGKYVVKPVDALWKFKPVSRAEVMTGSAIPNQNFMAKTKTSTTYTLSGTVTGSPNQNIVVSLNGDNTGSTLTDAAGNYQFDGLDPGTYTVTAQAPGYTFNVLNPTTLTNANATAPALSGTPSSGVNLNMTTINPLPQASVGTAYSNSTISSISGGTPPYHYQSDTFANGAPPYGMIVDINGNLTGTPTDAGQYTFGVCGSDQAGHTTLTCPQTSITVNPATVVAVVDNVTPSYVKLGSAGSCTGGVLNTAFSISAPNGVSWNASLDTNIGFGLANNITLTPSSGNGSGALSVTIQVAAQTPSSIYSSCNLTYNMSTFNNIYISFSDGTLIGITVYWTFVGVT